VLAAGTVLVPGEGLGRFSLRGGSPSYAATYLDKRELSENPECTVVLLAELRDSPSGGVQCFIVALSDSGQELGAFEVPAERRLLDAEKLRDLAVSPLVSVLAGIDVVLYTVALSLAGGIH